MALSRVAAAFQALQRGMSARQGLKWAREQGVKVRDATWFGTVGAIRNHYGQSLRELDRPLDRRPLPHEITLLPAKKARGYVYYVDLIVRRPDLPKPYIRPQAIHSSRLMSREAVVDIATQRYRGAVDRSQIAPASWGTLPTERVEGGIFAAVQKFQPGMLE